MNVFSFAAPLAHLINSMQLDDSSVSLLALLAGMAGGWWLTGWHEQLKAKRAKIARKAQSEPRKSD